jgi:hypothetical protein
VGSRKQQTTFRRVDVAAIIDGSQVLLDDGTYRVISLNNAPASSWWGEGTRWCTTGSGWFSGYRQYGELLYIEHRPKGQRWQLYIHNCEFRNGRNRRANGQVFARNHPTVMEALSDRLSRDIRATVFFGLARDGLKIEHSLNLRRVPIQSLPSGMYVRDDLDLRATGIQTLPKGLKVGGDLFLSGRLTPQFPDDLEVRGRIWLCDIPNERPIAAMSPTHESLTHDHDPDLIPTIGQLRGTGSIGHRATDNR